jgi:hypothetical protein
VCVCVCVCAIWRQPGGQNVLHAYMCFCTIQALLHVHVVVAHAHAHTRIYACCM